MWKVEEVDQPVNSRIFITKYIVKNGEGAMIGTFGTREAAEEFARALNKADE